MFQTDSVLTQSNDSTKFEGKVLHSQVITCLLTSSQMMKPNVQAYAIIQPNDNIYVMI
jgi:hypothetical protein